MPSSLFCGWHDGSPRVSSQSWHRTWFTCIIKGNTSYLSWISSIHKSYPVPQSAISIRCVLTLEGNRRRPLRFYHSFDWPLRQQYPHNWIIWNHKHLFLALWLWTPAGRLPLDSIKLTYWCYYGPSFLHTGMSGSCASTQTIKANKTFRWVRGLHRKWVPISCCEPPAVLVWEMIWVKYFYSLIFYKNRKRGYFQICFDSYQSYSSDTRLVVFVSSLT